MNDEVLSIPVSRLERNLIFALREVPESPLRARVLGLLEGLVRIAQEPCCNETQADGVPCASVRSQCDACPRVFEKARALFDRSFPAVTA